MICLMQCLGWNRGAQKYQRWGESSHNKIFCHCQNQCQRTFPSTMSVLEIIMLLQVEHKPHISIPRKRLGQVRHCSVPFWPLWPLWHRLFSSIYYHIYLDHFNFPRTNQICRETQCIYSLERRLFSSIFYIDTLRHRLFSSIWTLSVGSRPTLPLPSGDEIVRIIRWLSDDPQMTVRWLSDDHQNYQMIIRISTCQTTTTKTLERTWSLH